MATSNVFAGMSFSEAAQSEDNVDIASLTSEGTENTESPFAGMKFSELAAQEEESRKAERSEAMMILEGDYIPPEPQETLDTRLTSLEPKKPDNTEGEKAREKLAGAPGDFISGRYGVPKGISEENIRKTIDQDANDFRHKIKLGSERLLLSTAELLDFIGTANDYLTNSSTPDYIEVDGQRIQLDADFEPAVKEVIKATYRILGIEDKLEQVENSSDIPIKLMADNMGPSLLLGTGKKTVDTASDVSSTAGKFLKEEFKYSLFGTAVGTSAGAIAGGTLEDRQAIAEIFNVGGMFAAPFLDSIPSVMVAKKVMSKSKKAAQLFESENAYGLAEDVVTKHIASFVPESEVPAIQKRMDLVRRIQKIEPDFNPTVGNLIGTEESRTVQRIVDTKNPKFASDQYRKTKAAVDRLTKRLQTETDPTQKAIIASALKTFSSEANFHVQRLGDRIATMEEQLRKIERGDTRGVDVGMDIRGELKTLKKAYADAMEDMFAKVDPDDTVRFDARGLISSVKKLTSDTSDLDRILEETDTGFSLLNSALPRYIATTAKRSSGGSDIIFVPENLKKKETPYLTFNELKKLRSALLGRAVKISRKDPSSNSPRILNDIVEEIDMIVDEKMLKGDEDVAKRYLEARAFAHDEFYTRFREGVGGRLMDQVPETGDFKISADEIGPMFWKKGPKEANLEEFKRLFSLDNSSLKEKGYPEDKLKELADSASEVAREHLKGYAMRTLQDRLDASPTSNPLEVISRWETDYKGAIDSFDDIKEEIGVLKDQFTKFAAEKASRTERIVKINREVVDKYATVEESTVLSNFLNSNTSVEEVERTYRDILRGVSMPEGSADESSDAFALLFPETVDLSIDFKNPEVIKVRKAIQESIIGDLISKAYDAKLEGPSWTRFDKLMHDNNTKLEKIFDEKGLEDLRDYGKMLRLMGTENKPVSLPELNELKKFMDSVGFSPASILSRYYSASLGKVGPVYLATDALTRLLTGMSSKHFDAVYKNTMYDLDGLERVLRNSSNFDAAEATRKTKQMLKDAGISRLRKMRSDVLGKFFNEHMLLVYGRGLILDENIEERQEDFSREAAKESLTQYYLKMHDDMTGQPSRIRSSAYDIDDTEDEPDLFTEVEMDSDPRNAYEIMEGTFTDFGSQLPDQEALSKEPITKEITYDPTGGE